MRFEGVLSRFALRELLELSVASLISGAIEVEAPAGLHRIFFVEGACVHAAAPNASGFDAIWPLFELADAPFRIVVGCTTRERTINEAVPLLIEQAEALAQRWSAIRPHIPDLEIVPQLVAPSTGDHVRIFEEDWPVLSWVDGSRTIASIAKCAVLDPVEVCSGLLRLKERGLLTLERQRAVGAPSIDRSPPPRTPKPVVAPEPRPGFFARLLGGVPEEVLVSALAPQALAIPEMPVEYDDILRLLRA